MQIQSSTSDRKVEWLYTRPAFGRTGRSLSENNFAKERRDWIAILLREILQNALDARVNEEKPVTVKLSERVLSEDDAAFVNQLIPSEHIDRFRESVPHITDAPEDVRRFLVVEDFETTGLIGVTDAPDMDGKGQNWNAFWFREGEGGKEHGAGNGGAGQGKITYFSTSEIRTIFVYTVRKDDNKGLLYGASSFLRDYEFKSMKWLRDSYWGLSAKRDDSKIAVPSDDANFIGIFKDRLGITRDFHQTGMSLIIPSPRVFNIEEVIQVIIAEFFVPILRGDLVVQLADVLLDAASIEGYADSKLSDQRARELHTCMTKGYREFIKIALERSRFDQVEILPTLDSVSQLSESTFAESSLERVRNELDRGALVSLRFSVVVKPKNSNSITCCFDVHLSCPQELNQAEQAIVRRDLLIGEEPIGGGSLRQRARGLTLITSSELSKLLLSAEEATHLRWNARLPRLREYYKSGADIVSFVRNAMARSLEVITGNDQKRDFQLLAKYFPIMGDASRTKTRGKKSPQGKGLPSTEKIPPPTPKKLMLQPLADGCRVVMGGDDLVEQADFPIIGTLEFSYEGLDNDAFSEYDPLDFDVADSAFRLDGIHYTVRSKSLNVVEFAVLKMGFWLEIKGFDKSLRLRVRLNYKEASHAEIVSAD